LRWVAECIVVTRIEWLAFYGRFYCFEPTNMYVERPMNTAIYIDVPKNSNRHVCPSQLPWLIGASQTRSNPEYSSLYVCMNRIYYKNKNVYGYSEKDSDGAVLPDVCRTWGFASMYALAILSTRPFPGYHTRFRRYTWRSWHGLRPGEQTEAWETQDLGHPRSRC
jgi:hypothetical protein